MKPKHVNEDVEIKMVPAAAGATAASRRKIQQLVKKELLLTSNEPYRKAQVEVELDKGGKPKALVASLLRAYTYTADIVRVEVDPDLNVKSIKRLS
jgi:hypothetical protein